MKKESVDKKHKVVKKEKVVKKDKVVQKNNVDKKHKVVKKAKTVKKDKLIKKPVVEDIIEYDWKMKSNVHVRILSESKNVVNPESKIAYATRAEVEELEKEDDTLVITISFEGEIKDDFEDTGDETVKIDDEVIDDELAKI